jgi:hypothetical protein
LVGGAGDNERKIPFQITARKGAFSLVWVNPNPNPVELHPEEEDDDYETWIED